MFSLYAVILIVFDQCDVALQMDEHVMLCSCGEEETSIDRVRGKSCVIMVE